MGSSGIRNVHVMIVSQPADGVLGIKAIHAFVVTKNGTKVTLSEKTSQNSIVVRKVFKIVYSDRATAWPIRILDEYASI